MIENEYQVELTNFYYKNYTLFMNETLVMDYLRMKKEKVTKQDKIENLKNFLLSARKKFHKNVIKELEKH